MAIRAPAQTASTSTILAWVKDVADIITAMQRGRHNNVGTVTLTANSATTTLTDARIAADSAVIIVPTTANASAEIGAGTLHISEIGRVNGSIVITHANNAQADRTYRYAIMG
jgi:hypothetical protein